MKRLYGYVILLFIVNLFSYAGIEKEILDAIPEDSEIVAKEVVLAKDSAVQIWDTPSSAL